MSSELITIIDRILLLISDSENYHRETKDVYDVFGEMRLSLNEIRRRVKAASKRYVVAVVGLTNVGKSTLLNALFGVDLAPRRNGPCTAAPIEFVYGDSYQVNVEHYNSFTRPHFPCVTIEEVHERLTALADDSGAERSKSIKRVEVTTPLELLKHGLVIADTPGFGAAQIEGAEGSHEESLKRYLIDKVSQVFWVVLGEQGIGKREMEFRDSMFAQICGDIIVTRCEDWDDKDKSRFRQRFTQLFSRIPQFHFASGKLGLKAQKENDAQLLEEAGIVAIQERIRELSNENGRLKTIQDSILALCEDVTNWWTDYTQENRYLNSLWNPIALNNWKMFTENIDLPLIKQITNIINI
ncbi:MAG: dynamin family protein [Planctomycetaceae bacterium]|jgi:GTP-binding protein EngB required for normal cell division|nr:dynamin family protein [Planctomycetaceae bacterium]